MIRAWSRESLKFNLALALTFAVLAAGIVAAGLRFRRTQEETLALGIRNQLSAVADLKVRQIVAWRRERVGDAEVIASNPALVRLPAGANADGLRGWLESFRKLSGYREIALLRQGSVRLTASGRAFPVDEGVGSLCREALQTGQTAASDLQRCDGGPIYMDFAAPVPHTDEVVVLRVDAAAFLYPELQSWPVPSASAEIVLVGEREGRIVFLNDLRWDQAATMAVQGVQAVREDIDYRGVPVVAALRRIPDTPWALEAKVDAAEAYASSRPRSLMAGIVVGLLLALCAAIFGLLWRLQAARFRRQRLVADEERKSIEGRYAHLVSRVNDIVLLSDEEGNIVEVNDRAVEAYGYTREELLRMSVRDLRTCVEQDALTRVWETIVKQGWAPCEAQHRRKDGSPLLVEGSARVVEFDGRSFCQSILRDVSERKKAEEELRRVTRALRVLSACNQALVRSADEDRLYSEVCEAITAVGGYPMAWIGAPEQDSAKTVRVVRAAGVGKAYVDSIDVSWADEPRGRGPVGACLRTGDIAVCSDAGTDPSLTPWRASVERYGFKSVIALPLWCEGAILGTLAIYASESDAFHPEERSLLEELAGDLSYGVETRRRRVEQERAEEALRRSEREFRALFDNVNDAVFIVDTECRFLAVNQVACDRLGYSRDELAGMSIRDIDEPGPEPVNAQMLARHAQPGYGLLEAVHVRRDGSRFPVEINARKVDYRGAPAVLSVVRDISERKRAEAEAEKRTAELERARREAEKANRAKSEFLAHMSHEIRTPLNGIVGMSDLLLDTNLIPEQREFGETVRASARALLALVNDLLDWSRIEAGRMVLEPGQFDLAVCLNEIGGLMAPQARAKGLHYSLDAEMACSLVTGDAGRIRQIVLNLLNNAIKFTAAGRVTLRVRGGEPLDGKAVYRIEVEDSGPGIPADKTPLIFQGFTQADSSLVRRHEGAGLGLAISRQLTELMGGTLTVTSRMGVGSTFLLTLPLAMATVETVPPGTGGNATQAAGQGVRRVLLVEDNLINQRLGVRTLEKLGWRADVATNGREAVDMVREGAYDLILMDCRMPEMDGYTATREIRSGEKSGSHVPIVALTAHAIKGAREECLGAGMDDYVTKPITRGELERVLHRWTG